MINKALVIVAATFLAWPAWGQQAVTHTQPGSQSSGQASMGAHKGGSPKGASQPRGVVTGGTAGGGIALQSDQAPAQTGSAVSGGVSVNARDDLRSKEPPHNVKMVFSLNTGNYVSDVQVKVTDQSGRVVLEDVSNGPWLFANLPVGSYTATATYNGAPMTQKFTASKSGARTAQFRWPASVEQRGADSSGQVLGTGPQESRK